MPWPWLSGSSSEPPNRQHNQSTMIWPLSFGRDTSQEKSVNWNDSLISMDHFKDLRTWIPAFAVTTVLFGAIKFYRSYLRRIRSIDYIHPDAYRKRSLFGKVTSVGDGDGFHLFHTPGGRWTGWGWLRKVPANRKGLKGNTIIIRLAGVDAPEGAHFGRPAQPYSSEALRWLQSKVLHRYVRVQIYRRDQYERAVGTVYLRRWLFFRTDVGLEMLRRGLATSYEAKSGVEFGGGAMKEKYLAAEAEAKKNYRGLWSDLGGKNEKWFGLKSTKKKSAKQPFETPREYKDRMREADRAEKGEAK